MSIGLLLDEFFVNNVMKAEKVNITTLNLVYCENSLDQVIKLKIKRIKD